MSKKETTDFLVSLSLIILSACVLLFGVFKIDDLKLTLTIIFGFYTLIKGTEFIITFKDKDYQSLFTSIISLGACLAISVFNLESKYMILTLLIWMALMCLVKLKKADFYHDRGSSMWILRIFMLFIFLSICLLTGINLAHGSDIQILLIGNFFFINSVLEAVDPLVLYLIGDKQ